MKIVTDRGCDLTPVQMEGLEIHFAPMRMTLDGQTYNSGEDITPEDFYALMTQSEGFPTTSQATAGDFADIYRRLAAQNDEILSVHISSGLSGTLDSARAGADMVPEAKVTFWDTKTLGCPEGWQVEMAARGLQAGWPVERVLSLLDQVRKDTLEMFTLDTLKYLIHGGRISHMRGLLGSLLRIRPVITVDLESGKYVSLAQERTMKKAVEKMIELAQETYAAGSELRVQLMHGNNPEVLAFMKEKIESVFRCHWLPSVSVAPVLGAHTGPSVVAFALAPVELFDI
jgi:DegV family protein with EDD domain